MLDCGEIKVELSPPGVSVIIPEEVMMAVGVQEVVMETGGHDGGRGSGGGDGNRSTCFGINMEYGVADP